MTRTVTGQAFPTIYGPVQVKITVTDGRITAATAVQYPQDTPRDYQINSFAIPQLNQEAVAAGNAKIDAVSGATYTSGGYIGSLQNALDQAGIADTTARPSAGDSAGSQRAARGTGRPPGRYQYLLAMGRSMAGNLVRISVP